MTYSPIALLVINGPILFVTSAFGFWLNGKAVDIIVMVYQTQSQTGRCNDQTAQMMIQTDADDNTAPIYIQLGLFSKILSTIPKSSASCAVFNTFR
jgi:hypothetical protein